MNTNSSRNIPKVKIILHCFSDSFWYPTPEQVKADVLTFMGKRGLTDAVISDCRVGVEPWGRYRQFKIILSGDQIQFLELTLAEQWPNRLIWRDNIIVEEQ